MRSWTRFKQGPSSRFGCLTDGKTYDLYHPEMCMVGKRSVTIGITAQPADVLYDRTIKLDPLHIVRLEPLAAGSPKNGPLT
jgi:hypothetical protein